MTSILNLRRYRNVIPTRIRVKFNSFWRLVMWGPRKSYLWTTNSKLHKLIIDIQTTLAKLRSQDGNSREHRSRSQMIVK